MANNEAGAFLNITPDVLKKLDSFDEKLEKIEKHAHTAADALKNGFGKVVIDTTKLENAITSLANKMNALNSAGNAIGNIGTSAQGSARNVSSMNESLSRAALLMNQIGNSKISESSFSTWNIKGLNQYYSDLKKYVENADLSKPQQEAAIRAMQYMKMELTEQRKTDEQRAQSAEKAAQRKEEADRRAAKAAADLAKQQELAQRTTPQGALDYSKNTKSLKENVQAIEYLKKARLSLNTTDKNYQTTLQQINQAIAKHNQALQQAGVQSQNLATRHRNLMDTAGQLQRKIALVFSVSQIEGYISKLANVRGEFELQQRSLQAILQNKSQADQIFNKTVQLAVKSPFKIKELISYTKQLAAYRIESSKLYDTTKRLADVSAGLGVDMQRLILAYGQVKAAAYLRGTEVRQFTEAGINLYGELQRYFEEVKGEAYTTAQIVDMISKRKVTFEDIENIFKRLTESGGLFYNMQEIQAETLQGKISNLQDSIDVMLNSIGKANEDTLKGTIDAVKVLIDNWETVVEVAKTLGVVIGSLVITSKLKLASAEAGILTKMLEKGTSAATAFGKTLKASLPLMALGLAIQYVTNLIGRLKEYDKTISDIGNRKYEARLKIAKFDNEVKTDARKALSALVNEMNNAGFSIKIKTDLSEEEAKEQFESYKKQYEDFIEDIVDLETKYAAMKKGEGGRELIGGNIEESLGNYRDTFGELLIVGSQARKELLRISEESKKLTEEQKKELKELAVNTEDSVEGYIEMANKIREIKKVDISPSFSSFGVVMSNDRTSFGGLQSKVLEGLLNTSKGFDAAAEDARNSIIKLFGEVNKDISSDDKARLKLNIDTLFLRKEIDDVTKDLAYKIYDIPKVSNIEGKSGNHETNGDPKLERDILAERISLIKELNREYEKLNKVMGSDKAAKTVMERYASQLKDVKMPKNIIGDAFLPNKENTAKALQEFSKTISDFRKRIGAQKDANVLFDEKDAEDIKKQLDKTKKNIEAMFNGLDLHKKLKDAGLSEAEVQQLFPGLAKTLDDVEKEMKASYEKNFPKGEYLVEGTDANKQYLADLDKLNQQRVKESQDLVVELTKAYKTQLSDQLQLDRWYYEERTKIAKANLTEEQKAQYEANLQKQYGKKSDENTWKQFQNSDMYISMFENIESSSTRMLTAMRDKLASLRENLKDLPADQLKAIIKQQEKIDEMISKKNPFTGLTSGVKEYIQFLKERKELEEENIRSRKAVEYYTEQKNAQSQVVEQKRQEYDAAVKTYDITSAQAIELHNQLTVEKTKLSVILSQLVAEEKITEATAEQIKNGQKIAKTLSGKFSEAGSIFSEFSSEITNVVTDLENVFGTMSAGTKDTIDSIAEIAGGLGQTASGVGRIMSGDIIGGGLQAIGGLAKTIGSIFAIGDKKKEREIQRQIKNIETLGKAYDELKEKMEAAWSADDLRTQTKDTVANLDQQIASYQAMIKAEQDKKKTDKDRINEWNDAINELEKTKKEILDEERKYMGGIGGESEYKSAAESFVQAWMDAFNETGDGLKGLEENFDDFINNLFLKQASMRIANKFLEPLFQMIDLAVTEGEAAIAKGFDGSTDLTRQEMDKIVGEAKKQFPQLSEALEQLYNALGIKNNKTAELSSLTQSIQGITERKAEILESLLNSIRFFVSQQTTDISAIRALLDARYGLETEYSDSNPMLVELRTQTGYLEQLTDYISRVFAPTPNSPGPALRVVMQ
nr:MAG TPA: tail tape measure [Caudoviricetes sp.]